MADVTDDTKQPTDWQVIETLAKSDDLVTGVSHVDNELYVLRDRHLDSIEVYSTTGYNLLRHLSLPGQHSTQDMTSCTRHRCLYISDFKNDCVHRVDLLDGNIGRWPVWDSPNGVSVTTAGDVLVTCSSARKLKFFGTFGGSPTVDGFPHEITLQSDIVSPLHAVESSNGQFVVCHGTYDDVIHRVCLVGTDGVVVHSFGGVKGSSTDQLNGPSHLAIDSNRFVLVSDFNNHRVVLLSPTLEYVREIVSRSIGLEYPYRLCLVGDRQSLLYVAESCFDGQVTVLRLTER
jgi:hypothetical protein